jgi:hypothetical protein
VPVVLDLAPRERHACDLIRYFVLLASSKAAPCRWIDAEADYGLLLRIFRHRILVPRLIPLAQGSAERLRPNSAFWTSAAFLSP